MTPDLQRLETHLFVRAGPHLIGQTQSDVSPLPYKGDGAAERLQHVSEPASTGDPVFNSGLLEEDLQGGLREGGLDLWLSGGGGAQSGDSGSSL